MAFFTPEKRIQLQSYIEAGLVAATELARQLGCCARTVRREIDRLEAGTLNYTACAAQAHRAGCGQRSAANVRLKAKGELVLRLYGLFDAPERLSPEQVSLLLCGLPVGPGRRRRDFELSTPAIYAWLARERARCPEQPALWRGRGGRRRSTRHGATGSSAGWAASSQSVLQRPAHANERLRHGDIECDTLIGRQRDDYRLLVTIERRSRYVRLSKTRNRAWATANAARLLLADVELLSLSCDRGAEFARLPALFKDKLFVCQPYRADERGSCEHVNGLLREFFPHGVSLDHVSDDYIRQAQDFINNRPRKILNGLSPAQALHLPRSRSVRT